MNCGKKAGEEREWNTPLEKGNLLDLGGHQEESEPQGIKGRPFHSLPPLVSSPFSHDHSQNPQNLRAH